MHLFKTGKHGSGLGLGDAALDAWPALLEAWLRGLGLLTPDPSLPHAPTVRRHGTRGARAQPMNSNRTRLIGGVAIAATIAIASASAGQGPGRAPARVAPSLDAVLPHLDKAVVRVRTPSETQLATADASLEAARDGAASTDLTGLRLRDDLVVVAVPGTGPLPTSFDVGVFGAWAPAPVVGSDTAQRLVVVRAAQRPGAGPTPALKPAVAAVPGFLVRASSAGGTLDVKTVWVDALDGADVPEGAFVFGMDGSFAGLAATRNGKRMILPAAGVVAAAMALADSSRQSAQGQARP